MFWPYLSFDLTPTSILEVPKTFILFPGKLLRDEWILKHLKNENGGGQNIILFGFGRKTSATLVDTIKMDQTSIISDKFLENYHQLPNF